MKKQKYHARTTDHLRENVPAHLVAVSHGAEIPQSPALRLGPANRKYGTRYSARHDSRQRRARQTASLEAYERGSRYPADTVAPLQRPRTHLGAAVRLRRGESERGGEIIRRVDKVEHSEYMKAICAREGVRLEIAGAGFIRGGNWNNGANDGAFTLNLNNAPSNVNTNIGFRCSRYASYTSAARTKASRGFVRAAQAYGRAPSRDRTMGNDCAGKYRASTSATCRSPQGGRSRQSEWAPHIMI